VDEPADLPPVEEYITRQLRACSAVRRLPSAAGRSALAFGPHPHADLDRGTGEGELLAQPAFDVAPVAGLEESGGEEHEAGRAGIGLGAEQDPGLLAAAHRMRVCCGELTEEGVQLPGADAPVPGGQRLIQCPGETVGVPSGGCGDVDPGRPGDLHQLKLD